MDLLLWFHLRIWFWVCTTLPKRENLPKNILLKEKGTVFYSPEEVIIAHNEGKADLHAMIKVRVDNKQKDGSIKNEIIDTTDWKSNL